MIRCPLSRHVHNDTSDLNHDMIASGRDRGTLLGDTKQELYSCFIMDSSSCCGDYESKYHRDII